MVKLLMIVLVLVFVLVVVMRVLMPVLEGLPAMILGRCCEPRVA